MITMSPAEMTKLCHLWEFHRARCDHKGDMKIQLYSGGGIGTVTKAICPCGEEMDATDYYSW